MRAALDVWDAWRLYKTPPLPGSIMEQNPWLDDALRVLETEQGLIDLAIAQAREKG